MRRSHSNTIRPLTKKMKEILKETYDRELHQQAPYSIYYSQSAKGLVTRGLFYTKQYTACSKPYVGFYVTQLGLDYLNEMQSSKK